jgi:predicted nucleic-acid-binding Zn-ribbon protein
MKTTGKCPKCGSTEVIADAKAIDYGDSDWQKEMSVATFRKPDALIFKEQRQTTVSAWVCTACGYIEYYADHPDRIRVAGPSERES